MSRNFIDIGAQVGIESTPGVAVTADKALSSFDIKLNSKYSAEVGGSGGSRFATSVRKTKEWSEGSISGQPCVNALPYILGAFFGAPTTTTVEAATAYSHAYRLDTPKTLTVAIGDATAARKATGVFAKSFKISWGRNSGDAKVEADLIGAALAPVTLAAATATENAVIEAAMVDLYSDSTFETLGETKVEKLLKAELSFADVRDAKWYLNTAYSSIAGSVEKSAEGAKLTIYLENDETADEYVTSFATGTIHYVRLTGTGQLIGASETNHEELTIDLCVKVSDTEEDETDDLYARKVEFTVVRDAALWTHDVTVVNGIA